MFASQFDTEERDFERKKSAIASTLTILLHALLLLYLIFTILHTPIPPYPDDAGGMAVNFGTDDAGTGDAQPFTFNPGPTPKNAAAVPVKTRTAESAPEDILSSEKEDNNVLVPKATDKPKHKLDKQALFKPNPKPSNTAPSDAKKSVATEPTPQPKPDPNALFNKGAYGQPTKSKSDGTGGGNGDQGKANGDPNSKNYLGDGTGTGHGSGDLNGQVYLPGRKNLSKPRAEPCNSPGKVVIGIKVDQSGRVVEARFRRFDSTVFDDCNKNGALAAAGKALFNADSKAPEIQEGTITYIYQVH